jgi:hypothetical protein
MENKAADSPVCLRIPSFRTGKHNVEDEESQQNAKHSNELQNGHSGNIAVFFILYGLNQRGKHNANTEVIADVCEVYIEIPADIVDIIENTKACDNTHKAKCDVDGLVDHLCCPAFDHDHSPF